MLAFPLAACGGTRDAGDSPGSTRAAAGAENWNFEAGDFGGWRTVAAGSGAWHVYRDGATPPDPTDSDPNFPFAVPDPPEGRFAAVTDMSEAGRRILYRDLDLSGPQRLRLTVFYDNHAVGEFSTPRTLQFEGRGPNQQLRIDVMDPSAPIDAMSGRAVLATVFRTASGIRRGARPRRRRLSCRAGRAAPSACASLRSITAARSVRGSTMSGSSARVLDRAPHSQS